MNNTNFKFLESPRCGAKNRKGNPCMAPKVKDKKRCRLHGAYAGAPKNNRNAFRHGLYSAENLAKEREVREVLRQSKFLMKLVNSL